MKKGISAISGVTSPTVGEKYTYHISEWYPNTPISEREQAKVTWELFKKRSDGRFTTTHIKKKGDSSFTFGESSVGETYRLEGYLYQPEGGGLIITPKASKIPKICKVDLNYVDDSKGSVFSFTEKLRAKAHCINMFNKEVLFTLWEDDAKGSGHNTTNQLIDTKKAKVDLYGDAEVDFMLTKALMKKAMEGETDIRELEFYVTVEYYKTKKHTTSNVEIKNPSPTENKKPSQPTAIKKAKGSPAEHKPRSKKEEKGVFRSISETIDEIWDWAETQGIAQRDKPHTIEIPEGKSPAVIGKTKVEKKEEKKGGCFCKQEENQFYWSDKLTCDQRKKVLEVCQELWGEKNKKEKASQLMSIMYIETNKTFSPSADNGIGFSGLIQFNDAAAKGVGTTRAELKKMTFIKQMDYVKAYFMKRKDELNTMTDMYLLVMKPSAVGKGNDSNYAVFDESISVPDGDGSKTNAAQRQININREPWVTKYGYSSNPKFLTEKGEKEKRKKWVYTRQKYESRPGFIGGKTTIKEIEQVLKDEGFYLGKNHIFKGKCIDEKEIISNNKERAPWVDVAFEEFEKYKGITEKESPLKERISEYFKLSGSPSLTYKDAWCATFVHWCFQHTEYKDTNEKGNVGAFDWAEEGNLRIKGNSTKDGWINGEKSEVFVGAVIVFSFSHVAIIVGENKTGEKYIYLGGNQGSKVTGGQKICMGSVSKNSKDIFAIMKPKNYNPKENEKKLPIYDVEEENSNSSSR
ncbi:hypothetical protein B0A78_12245 [Flavobacterium columnare NBRC 100251 = ATCC 23463]|uniref:hypothetical protein n=1 Tax=Flavobacterium columnare TaxID=996 RepID=UPI000BEA3997|nr:hypothetical protein [Flavobacterium columnare]PDS22322.1 hypothetical protein B0A78_12245 [Flavobacterium columnare NBRC 100251 = ATCC 23463]